MQTTRSDAEIVSRCRMGDAEAWNALVDRFSRYVYAVCVRAFRLSREDAEDVFQEVFARVYERLGDLRNDDALRPWIAQLTRRLCVDRLRAERREAVGEEDVIADAAVDETLSQLDDAMTVRASLDALGEPCREILDRFFCRDESYRTIGDVLDLPSGTIASRIARCLRKMHQQMEGRS